MLNAKDQESLIKSKQCANLLVQDLRELVSADNLLLGEVAIEILQQSILLEQKLNRLVTATAS